MVKEMRFTHCAVVLLVVTMSSFAPIIRFYHYENTLPAPCLSASNEDEYGVEPRFAGEHRLYSIGTGDSIHLHD
jgi:hypothetical protein